MGYTNRLKITDSGSLASASKQAVAAQQRVRVGSIKGPASASGDGLGIVVGPLSWSCFLPLCSYRLPEGGDARWCLKPRGGGVVGPDVIEAVYVCLQEAGPMFGHLYGLGSFLA